MIRPSRLPKIVATLLLAACLCIAVALLLIRTHRDHEVRKHLDDIRAGAPWRNHSEWFQTQPSAEKILRREIVAQWRSDPKYATALVELTETLPRRSRSLPVFLRTIVKEHLRDACEHWDQWAAKENLGLGDFITTCMIYMEHDVESQLLLLDYVEMYPSDVMKCFAIGRFCGVRNETARKEREVLGRAILSDNWVLRIRTLRAMTQLRCREGVGAARRALSRPEAKRWSLRSQAAALLVVLNDTRSAGAVRAYVKELEKSFIDAGPPAELGDPDYVSLELEMIAAAMVNAPTPEIWLEDLTALAELRCTHLRQRIAELISQVPHGALMPIAKKLVKDKNAEVRAAAERAVAEVGNVAESVQPQ